MYMYGCVRELRLCAASVCEYVRVCVCIGIREGVFTQQKQLCQQRKEQSILELLSSLCSTAACRISAESWRLMT